MALQELTNNTILAESPQDEQIIYTTREISDFYITCDQNMPVIKLVSNGSLFTILKTLHVSDVEDISIIRINLELTQLLSRDWLQYETLPILQFLREQDECDKIIEISHTYITEYNTNPMRLYIISNGMTTTLPEIKDQLEPKHLQSIFYDISQALFYLTSAGIDIPYFSDDMIEIDESYNIKLQFIHKFINWNDNPRINEYALAVAFPALLDNHPTNDLARLSPLIQQNATVWGLLNIMYEYFTGTELLSCIIKREPRLYLLLGMPTDEQFIHMFPNNPRLRNSFMIYVEQVTTDGRCYSLESKLAHPKFPPSLVAVYKKCISYNWTDCTLTNLIESEYFSSCFNKSDFVTCSKKYSYVFNDTTKTAKENMETLVKLVNMPLMQKQMILSLPHVIV